MISSAPDTGLPPDHLLRQLLDAIAAHPEVREPLLRALLTEDFLTLPHRMEKLEGEFQEFREETRAGFRAVNERIDATNSEVRALSDRLDENTGRLDENTGRLEPGGWMRIPGGWMRIPGGWMRTLDGWMRTLEP